MKTRSLLAAVVSLLCTVAQLAALDTAFTYQGRFNENGNPFTGNAEFTVTLWSHASDGEPSYWVASNNPPTVVVSVTNGLFVLPLDFGDYKFPGQDRWLQLEVRKGNETFVTLAPRQKIAPTPYAFHAANAGSVRWENLGDLPAGFADGTDDDFYHEAGPGLISSAGQMRVDFGDSGVSTQVPRLDHTHPNHQLSGSFTNPVDFVALGNSFSGVHFGSFAGNGSALSNVNVSTAFGTLPAHTLPANVLRGDESAFIQPQNPGVSLRLFAATNLNSSGNPIFDVRDKTGLTNYFWIGSEGTVGWSGIASGSIGGSAGWANGVSWNNISGIPTGFGDGIDNDTPYYAGEGIQLSNRVFWIDDGSILPRKLAADFANLGQVLKWNGSEVAFADDKDTTYAAGLGLSLNANTFMVNFQGNGASAFAARSDHHHDDNYAELDHAHAAESLTSGTLPSGRLKGPYHEQISFLNETNYFEGTFKGDGQLLKSLNATELVSGTVPVARLPSSVSVLGDSIESFEIADGTIVNTDISEFAGITDDKLAMITSPGKVANSATTATASSLPNRIVQRDASGNFSAATITATAFAGNGSNLSALNADHLTSGTVSNTRLSANVSLLGSGIESSEITDGTIANADISAGAGIADSKLATIATAGKVADSALSATVSKLGSSIDSSEILDGAIVNADISASAAIADSKLETISTPGKVADSALSATISKLGSSIDSSEITDASIVNADIAVSAAIADSKLATISTAGKVADSALSSTVSKLGQSIETSEIIDDTIMNVDISALAAISDTKLATLSTAGKVADSALSANVALLSRSPQTFAGTNSFNGWVGIGTTTPAADLHVRGSSTNGSIIITPSTSDSRSQILLAENTSASLGFIMRYAGDVAGNPLYFIPLNNGGVEGDPVMTLERNGGFVGIGTNDPQSALHVAGTVTATAFNPSSDRNLKEHFAPVNPREILNQVAALEISRWNFIGDARTPHLGPMAQDFYAAFALGTDEKHIATVDADGVALAAIQGLNQKLEQNLKQKEAEITELKQRLDKLEQLIKEKSKE
jgi:hypothetical protein